MFTRSSVVCADGIVTTSSSYGFLCTRARLASGYRRPFCRNRVAGQAFIFDAHNLGPTRFPAGGPQSRMRHMKTKGNHNANRASTASGIRISNFTTNLPTVIGVFRIQRHKTVKLFLEICVTRDIHAMHRRNHRSGDPLSNASETANARRMKVTVEGNTSAKSAV